MKKLLFFFLAFIASAATFAQGRFDLFSFADWGGVNDGFFVGGSNDDDWIAENYQRHFGWDAEAGDHAEEGVLYSPVYGDNAYLVALCLSGKTTAVGKITSPTFSNGCGTLTLKYAGVYGDDIQAYSVHATVYQDGMAVKEFDIVGPDGGNIAKNEVYTWTEEVNVEGDFSIEFVNNCPNGGDENEVDAASIWDIKWTRFTPRAITSLDQLSNDKTYTIRARSGMGYICYAPEFSDEWVYICGSTYDGSISIFQNEVDKNDPNNLWQIVRYNDDYYLYNVGAKQYVKHAPIPYGGVSRGINYYAFSNLPTLTEIEDFGLVGEDYAGTFGFRPNSDSYTNYMCLTRVETEYPVRSWRYEDPGVAMIIEEADYPADINEEDISTAFQTIGEFAQQLVLAKADYKKGIGEFIVTSENLYTDPNQFYSAWTEPREGSVEEGCDGDPDTFWHSEWSSGSVAPGTHDFYITLPEAVGGGMQLAMTRRQTSLDHILAFDIYASSETQAEPDAANFEFVGTVDTPYGENTETVTAYFDVPEGTRQIRFVIAKTDEQRGYGHFAEFQLRTGYLDPESYNAQHPEAAAAFKEAIDKAESIAVPTEEDLQALIDAHKAYNGFVVTHAITSLYQLSNDKTYTIHAQSGYGYICYAPEKSEDRVYICGATATREYAWGWQDNFPDYQGEMDKNDPNNLWQIVKFDGNYYLYNVGAKQFARSEAGTGLGRHYVFTGLPTPIQVQDNGTVGSHYAGTFGFRTDTDNPRDFMCLSHANAGEPILTYYYSDEGSIMIIEETDYPADINVEDIAQRIELVEGFAEQIALAKAEYKDGSAEVILTSDNLYTDSNQFYSAWTEPTEGSVEAGCDGDPYTFWHSVWSTNIDGVAPGTHDFYITLPEAVGGGLQLAMTRRNSSSRDHILAFDVYASSEAQAEPDAANFEFVGTVDTPYGGDNGETVTAYFAVPEGTRQIRFVIVKTDIQEHGYGHFAEFQLRTGYLDPECYNAQNPNAAAAFKEAIDKAESIAVPTEEDLQALVAARKAYQKGDNPDVDPVDPVDPMPKAGKVYNIRAESLGFSDKVYYVGAGETPETAPVAWLCDVDKDGKFCFISQSSDTLRFCGWADAGTAWTITPMSKLDVPGDYANSAAVAMQGTHKDGRNGIYLLVDYGKGAYDHADNIRAPWDTDFTSFYVFEETDLFPINAASVSPAETEELDGISKIVVTYPVDVVLNGDQTTASLRNAKGETVATATASVEGGTVTFTFPEAVSAAGHYVFSVPEGFLCNADNELNLTAGQDFNLKVVGTFQSVKVSPVETEELDKISKVVVTYPVDVVLNDGNIAATLCNAVGDTVAIAAHSVKGRIVTFTFPEEVAVAGRYVLSVPERLFCDAANDLNFAAGQEYNLKVVNFFQSAKVSPEETEELDEISEITVTYPVDVVLNDVNIAATLCNAVGDTVSIATSCIKDKVVTFMLDKPVAAAGRYILSVPERLFCDAGNDLYFTAGQEYNLKVVNFFQSTSVSPVETEELDEISEIAVTYPVDVVLNDGNIAATLCNAVGDTVSIAAASVEGRVVTFTFPEEVAVAGRYVFNVPERLFCDAANDLNFAAGQEYNLKVVNFFQSAKVSPVETEELDEISEITVTYPVDVVLNDDKAVATLRNTKDETVATATASIKDNVVTFTLAEPVAAAGRYVLNVPERLFCDAGNNLSFTAAQDFGLMVVTTFESVSVQPTETEETKNLSEITVTYPVDVVLNDVDAEAILLNVQGETMFAATASVNGNAVTFMLPEAIATGGHYVLSVPERLFCDAGNDLNFTAGQNFNLKVVDTFRSISVSPTAAEGLDEITEITVTYPVDVTLYDENAAAVLLNARGQTVATATASAEGNTVTFAVPEAVTTGGHYVLSVPERLFCNAANDLSFIAGQDYSLHVVTLFNAVSAAVESDVLEAFSEVTVTYPYAVKLNDWDAVATIYNADNEVVTTATASVYGNEVTFTFDEAVTESGNYGISIPKRLLCKADDKFFVNDKETFHFDMTIVKLKQEAATIDELLDYTVEFDKADGLSVPFLGLLGAIFDEGGNVYAIALAEKNYNQLGSVEVEGSVFDVHFAKFSDCNSSLKDAVIQRIGGFIQPTAGVATVYFCPKSFIFNGKIYGGSVKKEYTLTGNGNPTDIESIGADGDMDRIYDLQGRRVQTPVKGNLYIQNGKKVMK